MMTASASLAQRRADLLERLRTKIARGEAVVGGGAGTVCKAVKNSSRTSSWIGP